MWESVVKDFEVDAAHGNEPTLGLGLGEGTEEALCGAPRPSTTVSDMCRCHIRK